MPINSTHPLYDRQIAHWQRCRDCYDGDDAVKARNETYLPKPGGLSASQYTAYKTRALFYEAAGRTVDGFVGSIARKDPVIEVPTALMPMVDDATGDGVSLNEFTKLLCCEAILQARGGILVDYDETLARPYFVFYRAEDVTNWSFGSVILRETKYEADDKDRFKQVPVEQYRELSIVEGVYTVTVWRKSKTSSASDEWVAEHSVTPHARGATFDEIPFFWVTPLGNTERIEAPPLLGLVNVCLAHYRNSADYEHGLHFSGLPTLYVTGASDTDGAIHVGSMAAIVLNDANAKVGYAEVKGDFTGLKDAMHAKEDMMAVLGASVFSDSNPRGVEAAETARIRTSGETSLLTGITTSVETTLKAALECASRWLSADAKIEVTLNREYVDTTLDGPTLTGLVQAYQAGALSLNAFLFALQQGELLPPDTDIEVEAAAIEAANDKRAAKVAALTS